MTIRLLCHYPFDVVQQVFIVAGLLQYVSRALPDHMHRRRDVAAFGQYHNR